MESNDSTFNIQALSSALADAVATASADTVTVKTGESYPASGVYYRPGRVLTAAHRVEGAEEIEIIDGEGTSYVGTVRGLSPGYDVALIEIDTEKAATTKARNDEIRTGELVLALARPTEDGVQSSFGVVNIARGAYRPWRGVNIEGVMRSDASRFPGFSGGPLVDVSGRFVGLNVFGDKRRSSLTLPSALIEELYDGLETGEAGKIGYIGVRSQPADLPAVAAEKLGRASGLLVIGTEDDGPALLAGIMVGDIIVSLDGNPVEDHESLLRILSNGVVDSELQTDVIRGGEMKPFTVKIAERPRGDHTSHHHDHHRRFHRR